MLAQNFMTAEALGITEVQLEALIKALGFFERGEVPDGQFNMRYRWAEDCECGTAVCIIGWVDKLNPKAFENDWNTSAIDRLFRPHGVSGAMDCSDLAKGAHALRNYLTTGEADWPSVMAEGG